ncbi:MAG: alpha/beta hydrolase [Candidatus Pacebacteria bacterium]|nr:alpha/beta hydrolase [Candidatus Paceibacterota bacterium]
MDKKRLLIVRGWSSKREHWREAINFLEERGFEILLPDLPGVNDGKHEKKPWTVNDYKNWILRITEKKNWDNFNLLGHSFGGTVAVKFAADLPNKIENLILSSPAVAGSKSLRTILFYITAQTTKSVFSLPVLRKKFPKIKEKLSARGIKDYYFESGTRKKTLKGVAKENHRENLGRIKVKTLILWGSDDDSISPKYAQEIKKIIPNSKIIIFPSVKHHPHRESLNEFAEEIINFIM